MALLDGLVMAGFFIPLYPMARVGSIFVREVGFKFFYAGMIYGALRGMVATPKAPALFKHINFSNERYKEIAG